MIPLLYLTDRKNSALIPDEAGIERAFAEVGVSLDIRVWNETDWSAWRNVLVRTPWDYARDPGLFLDKVAAATAAGASVVHPENIIRWNIDKRYLVQLSEAGHRVVPTHVEERFSAAALPGYFDRYGPLVLKPRVGAGGKDTFKVYPGGDAGMLAPLEGVSVLVQPFIPEIEAQGEYSFIFFDEVFSHSVLKKARTGEFRVQHDHGGTVHPYTPAPGEVEEVSSILRSVGLDTVYARVDVVRWNGSLHLMELEILEPELFFRFCPEAMARFARAVRKRLKADDTDPEAPDG